jgi:hypothetical protein
MCDSLDVASDHNSDDRWNRPSADLSFCYQKGTGFLQQQLGVAIDVPPHHHNDDDHDDEESWGGNAGTTPANINGPLQVDDDGGAHRTGRKLSCCFHSAEKLFVYVSCDHRRAVLDYRKSCHTTTKGAPGNKSPIPVQPMMLQIVVTRLEPRNNRWQRRAIGNNLVLSRAMRLRSLLLFLIIITRFLFYETLRLRAGGGFAHHVHEAPPPVPW